jgi:hypothetical protein
MSSLLSQIVQEDQASRDPEPELLSSGKVGTYKLSEFMKFHKSAQPSADKPRHHLSLYPDQPY